MMVHEKALRCLMQHSDGMSSDELAAELYGETGYDTQGRAAQIIQHLRRKGYRIRTAITFDSKNRVGKYHLLLRDEHNDESSSREGNSEQKRGSR